MITNYYVQNANPAKYLKIAPRGKNSSLTKG